MQLGVARQLHAGDLDLAGTDLDIDLGYPGELH
jgi:hypothetical protein